MFCPHCGTNIPDSSKFCSNCGNPVTLGANADFGASDRNAEQAQPFAQAPYHAQDGGPVPPSGGYVPPYEQYQDPSADSYTYQDPANAVATPGSPMPAGALQTNRDIVVFILLTIITCGIYAYWFIYRMAQDANVICQGDGEETPGVVIYILLSIVTCGIYADYWMYKLANRLKDNGPRYGIDIQEGGSDVLLWIILGLVTCGICWFIAMNIIIQNMNTLSVAYNRANGYFE